MNLDLNPSRHPPVTAPIHAQNEVNIMNLILIALIPSILIPVLLCLRPQRVPGPLEQTLIDARNRLLRQGHTYHGYFTHHLSAGIGTDTDHDIIGALAAADPAYALGVKIYDLPSVIFVRNFSYRVLAMPPEDVNDKLDFDCTIGLLDDAIKAARDIA